MLSTEIIQPQAMPGVFGADIYSATSTEDFAIPAATSTSETDTCVIDDGFLPITSEPLPPDGDGVAPSRKNFNGLFYLSTDQRVFLQNGGVITFDQAVSDKIGGYPAGAILGYVHNGEFNYVRSLINNNKRNFVATPSYINGTYWAYCYDRQSVITILKQIYPVGAIYIGTTSTCPMAALFGTWTLTAKNRCLQGSGSLHAAGETVTQGLPNITGWFQGAKDYSNASPNHGAFYGYGQGSSVSNSGDPDWLIGFDASRSSSVYGANSRVQPYAYVVNIWERTA